MSIPFQIAGARTVIPGVYSTFSVSNSLPAPVPAGRSIYIIGEADEGAPGSELDTRAVFFTDFQSVRAQYYAGDIVDAARMIFSNQPSPVFGGAVQRLYVYKTNASIRASKDITAPTNYGSLVAARYGDRGDQLKSQIKTGQAESKPTRTFSYLPSPAARTFRASVNGVMTVSTLIASEGVASAFVTAMAGVTGLTTAGGAARTTIVTGPMTLDTTVAGDQLTLTRSAGTATFDTASIQVGDTCWIDTALTVSGGTDQNAGSYTVVSRTTTTLVLKQLKSNEVNAQALAALLGVSVAAADLKINAPVSLTVTATTAEGAGASLEVLETLAEEAGLGLLVRDADLVKILSAGTAAVASVSASVPSAGKLLVTMTGGSWSTTPKVGDLVRISRGSQLQGATLKNVGLMVVQSASGQSLTLAHLSSGMTTEAVASATLNGSDDALLYAPSYVSTATAARRMDSTAERKVQLVASSAEGESMPTTLIGGNVAFELGYWQSGVTACTASIDANRNLTITPTGGGSTLVIKTGKYKTLQDLANYLNSQTGVYARVPDNRFKSLPSSSLDMATVSILAGQSVPAYNGRWKKDYYDWKQYFADNFSLLAFKEGTMVLKVGLPTAEATTGYLSGAALGATSAASIQAGLDEGLKIDVRIVVPLFSRDAQYDVEDGNTDSDSSYTIASVNAAAKAHASTASSTLFRKERFAYTSFDGSFTDSMQAASEASFERTKMGFQRHDATDGNGEIATFLPWMAMCAVAAGRVQAQLGTSMLRKPLLLNSAEHVGQLSLFTDTITQDFNPDDRGHLENAIAAGLMVLRSVTGFGVRMESPDLTTRSRDNDPQAWVWERENVLFTCDEVTDTCRRVLENFIGNRTSDTPAGIVKSALESVLLSFIQAGALLSASVTLVKSLGNQYVAELTVTPTEALEAITLNVLAVRATTA